MLKNVKLIINVACHLTSALTKAVVFIMLKRLPGFNLPLVIVISGVSLFKI